MFDVIPDFPFRILPRRSAGEAGSAIRLTTAKAALIALFSPLPFVHREPAFWELANPMKFGTPILILLFSLFLVSCSKNKLPGIKDPETLRKDCATLYQKFPETVRTNVHIAYLRTIPHSIPQEKWTPAVLALKPVEVLRCQHGICILIGGNVVGSNTKGNAGYFVFCGGFLGPSDPSTEMGEYFEDGLTYIKTSMKGIYEFPPSFTPIL